MYTKDENGKVKRTIANIIKMKLHEHIYYSIFEWKVFQRHCQILLEVAYTFITSMFGTLLNLIVLILFPIYIIYYSWNDIRKCKIMSREIK